MATGNPWTPLLCPCTPLCPFIEYMKFWFWNFTLCLPQLFNFLFRFQTQQKAHLHGETWSNTAGIVHFSLYVLFFFFWYGPFFGFYWMCYNIVSVLCFGVLARRHGMSWLLDQGLNPLQWKVKSYPLDHQESLSTFFFFFCFITVLQYLSYCRSLSVNEFSPLAPLLA